TRPCDGFTAQDRSNLEIILQAMEVIGRKHDITGAFLQQACLDIERNDLTAMLRFPAVERHRHFFDRNVGSNIPLITRSSVSRHSKVTPVLPGRLPLNEPQGKIVPGRLQVDKSDASNEPSQGGIHDARGCVKADCFQAMLGAVTRNVRSGTGDAAADGKENKRRRLSSDSSTNTASFVLPDRTSSSTSSPAQCRGPGTGPSSSSPDLSGSSHTTPPGLGNTPEENRIDLGALQGRNPPAWQAAQMQAMHDSLFLCPVSETPFGVPGYNEPVVPTAWDTWTDAMTWGDNSMAGPGPGP
ncbi:hypothetical protein E4U53_003737, partial [Claviceps sorghi]